MWRNAKRSFSNRDVTKFNLVTRGNQSFSDGERVCTLAFTCVSPAGSGNQNVSTITNKKTPLVATAVPKPSGLPKANPPAGQYMPEAPHVSVFDPAD